MAWQPFQEGRTIGQPGSENGVTVRDEEHPDGARITLENVEKRRLSFAVTCGIYGWMVHTRDFGDEAEASFAYEKMKPALARIASAVPRKDDPELRERTREITEAIGAFVRRFP